MLAVAGAVLFASTGWAQISPGPLSRAHASLGGPTNCTSCHRVGGQAAFKCLECHTEIAARLAGERGYHARVVTRSAPDQQCAKCHSEHNGADFALIRWQPSPAQFDHRQTGWPLAGKHAGLTCAQCHTAAHISPSEKPSIRMKDLNRTFLGLTRECGSCHNDQHAGRLGTACEQCHNTSDWKSVEKFDHARTRFALTGAHAAVNCEKCHTAGADGKVRWAGLAFGRCNACHEDPHRGSFTAGCASCHHTSGWKSVSAAVVATKFDHASTKFPLLGKHAEVRCAACHANGDFKKEIAFRKCSDCHRPDPHGGQFAERADKGECSACHTVGGFKPATFTVKDHAASAYPLVGKHVNVACAKCHVPAGTATLFKIKFGQCTDCHRDPHLGQFQAAPHRNRCQDCHTVQGFHPSTFTLAEHMKSAFSLTGAHVAVACGDCHKPAVSGPLQGVAQFRFPDRSCTTCHADPHDGQFGERMAALREGKPLGCEACHAISTWKEVARFDHATTRFPLTGTHRAVACADCHRPPNLETTLANVDFRSAPMHCEDCHNDPHGAQFANAAKVTPCAGCHTTEKWKPSTFDHTARTSFPLEGVHKNVRCEGCHKATRTIDERTVLFYKPTPKECAACHGAKTTPVP